MISLAMKQTLFEPILQRFKGKGANTSGKEAVVRKANYLFANYYPLWKHYIPGAIMRNIFDLKKNHQLPVKEKRGYHEDR
jgi:hypothetical protein